MFRTIATSALLCLTGAAAWSAPDPDLDILVTFDNQGANIVSGSIRAPYRARKRYAIAATARKNADDIASEFALEEIDHWPIKSLGVYCFVYRVPAGADRDSVIALLRADQRIDSVQPLQTFATRTTAARGYNDTYARYQHGLDAMGIESAHRLTKGEGVRIAMIDSNVDKRHEDLRGRIRRVQDFSGPDRTVEKGHGTAIASVIGAKANNSIGIVGIAPESNLELLVACWAAESADGAICDSFTLAKALDKLANAPPDVVNMSLSGPNDPLLARLITYLVAQQVIIVAANTAKPGAPQAFPANIAGVIGASMAGDRPHATSGKRPVVFAPGKQIMVAAPSDEYEFQSGSSLAAAHVSGVVALFLAYAPDTAPADVIKLLQSSQRDSPSGVVSVDACRMISAHAPTLHCSSQTSLVQK